MCNLYSVTKGQAAIVALTRAMVDRTGDLPPLPGIFPDPKAMPVILRTPDQIETWMTAPAEEALKLQAPLPDGLLKIVATGVKEDVAA